MRIAEVKSIEPEIVTLRRQLAEQALSRAAGAPLLGGNCVRLLIDGKENYPAWMEAITSARKTVHLEMYFIKEDEVGHQFIDLLVDRARAGIRVRVLLDWLGMRGRRSSRFWRPLREAGGYVRRCNPPRFDSPFGWTSRDHRKLLTVDSQQAFVSGLCIGEGWVGHPDRGIEAWRDTGIEIRGPAVADVERAFSQVWALTGAALAKEEIPARNAVPSSGHQMVRVIASTPETAPLYRLDLLVAALARRSLWLTDAYFMATPAYVEALGAAARDGVDVRLLVPGASDLPIVATLSRTIYRSLLQAGVRVFEWNGSMLHAKTGVADGRWARVGSSNLNLASWTENWELDVMIEDEGFASTMEELFLRDLERSTEIVLSPRRRVRLSETPQMPDPQRKKTQGSAKRAVVAALGVANAVGGVLGNRRLLGPAEAGALVTFALLFVGLALAGIFFPWLVVLPLVVIAMWIALALLARAYKLRFGRTDPPGPEPRNP